MQVFFSEQHERHAGDMELVDGRLRPCVETPERARAIVRAVRESGLGEIAAPRAFGLEPVRRVHDPAYLDFLASAWDEWHALGREHHALPTCWPIRGMGATVPTSVDGKLSYYSFDAGSPITAGTYHAALGAVDVALGAAEYVLDRRAPAFALCRPPGHHAARDYYGGYCYLNNAAVAAQYMRDAGAERVAILDIDYHHGNGTQAIFYARADVFFASLHADPADEYPYFTGHAHEIGEATGRGTTANFPLPPGTAFPAYAQALDQALERIRGFAPGALIVSLGVDTFERDPIARFRLGTRDLGRVGQRIAGLDLPALFVMEGGYALDAVGQNTVAVLSGFERGATNQADDVGPP